jgi:hypothetical protein
LDDDVEGMGENRNGIQVEFLWAGRNRTARFAVHALQKAESAPFTPCASQGIHV